MSITVRKIVRHREETVREMGQDLTSTHVVAWVAAVIENPYPEGYVQDLVTTADEIGQEIGALLGPPVVELLGEPVEAFGKAALVGLDGEVEHGSALIHNLRFGNEFRNAAEGTELLPAAEKVGPTGSAIDVPLKHKLDAKTRSHHQTITIVIPDAPRPREIVVACVASNAGRPLARLATFGAEVAEVSA
ncbi:amino acid synthesis family protein [Ruicaihuangia caeni]|uniref:Amino acid synthesis family protein n=1 Tax=Ruicaihuangia caeni TaxID=3042517 RepID=A0AAW6TCA3_9MICO|nr:amino acid synthesis family protein [Klugiella sp. YN-L-19]MDI2099638.1 amino acid synthesis family protein [Klugiella sp. YN-L-19]